MTEMPARMYTESLQRRADDIHRSPSPRPGRRSLTPQSGSSNERPKSEALSLRQEKHQDVMRKQVESKLAGLMTVNNKLNTALEQHGLNVSSEDLEVELYDQRNMIASTHPELLDSNYETRIEIMDKISEKLSMKLNKRKETLALITKEEAAPAEARSEPKRRSNRLCFRKEERNQDYYYY